MTEDEGVDLAHHGDRDIAPGLVDLAVNVRPRRTPGFIVDAVTADPDWSVYPDPSPLCSALANHHRLPVGAVLPTAGGAEGFTLIARALSPRRAVVIHPQFTEPESALLAAGHQVHRHLLTAETRFRLNANTVDEAADLVMVGNPTNPTSRLHPRSELERLRRPGRVLVVDEAFMDLVPGESESLVSCDLTGVLVLRSLTKTWGIAGLRAGYVVGEPTLIERLASVQTPWSVSTPAIRAGLAVLTPAAQRLRTRLAATLGPARDDLAHRLTTLGLTVVGPAQAPFLLVDTSPLGKASVREPLARAGFAVRRGETFPGLGRTWIRVAVRDSHTHEAFTAALARLT